ncbi:UNVERIFIED_CONTAM: hypothetical protein GTU68_037556 [Idotea baltica]|nr:hypothetical protein [Idotea baltica]
MEIYHNPRCRKSRETLVLLEENGINPDIRLYLDSPPDKKELKSILKKLDIEAHRLVRKTEAIYKDNYKGQDLSEDGWIDAMITYPKLIERPIVITDNQAVIGRPPENVEKLF